MTGAVAGARKFLFAVLAESECRRVRSVLVSELSMTKLRTGDKTCHSHLTSDRSPFTTRPCRPWGHALVVSALFQTLFPFLFSLSRRLRRTPGADQTPWLARSSVCQGYVERGVGDRSALVERRLGMNESLGGDPGRVYPNGTSCSKDGWCFDLIRRKGNAYSIPDNGRVGIFGSWWAIY